MEKAEKWACLKRSEQKGRVPKAANTFDEAKTHYFEQFATVKTGFILNMRLTVTSE